MNKKYSILMGDIIASRDVEEITLYKDFNTVITNINKKHAPLILSPLTITLGDEFQALTNSLSDSFLLANIIRMELLNKKIKMRFVIGNASIDESIINKKTSWNMLGPGLAEAREMLNDKKNPNSYRFSLLKNNKQEYIEIIEKLLSTVGNNITEIEDHWTQVQLQTITKLIQLEITRTKLAEKLGKSRMAVYKILKAARLDSYEEQVSNIKKTLKYLDEYEVKK